MAANNLFAGMEVKGKIVKPSKEQEARKLVVDTPEISSLFNGLEVGGVLIQSPEAAADNQAVIGGAMPATPTQQTQQPRYEIKNSPFPEAGQETSATRDLPELGQGGLLSNQPLSTEKLAATFGGLTANDPKEMASILQKQYPNVIGIQYDPAGNIIAANNETGQRVVLNKPGLSQIDVMQALGLAAAFAPAAMASTPVAAVAGIGGLAAKAGLGATASGLTQAAIEGLQQEMGGDIDEDEIAFAASFGGAAELLGPAVKAFRQWRRGRALDVAGKEVADAVESIRPGREAVQAVEDITGTNVGLFQAQQTQQPSTLLKQRLLPQLDAGAKTAAKALEKQNAEAFEATTALVNSISSPESVATGSKRFKAASIAAIDAKKARRSDAVRPLYKEALDNGADVNLTPTNTIIDDMLKDAPETGEFFKSIKKVKSLIAGSTDMDGNLVKPSLRRLQKAKFDIDNMLENYGDNALGNTTKRDVVSIKRSLVEQMENASPLYKEANDEFSRLSPAVAELQDSIIGGISKMDDVSLKNITTKLFDATESNPEVIKQAKKVIDSVDPGAWNDILRVEFQRRFAGIETLAEDMPGELVGNVPGQLRRAIFGNPEKRRVLLSALSTEQRKNFVYLDEVLRRSSSGRQAGSPTAPFGEVLSKLRGTMGVVRDIIVKPIQSLQATGERTLFDSNVSKLTEVLFNPKWEPRLRELRSISPESARAGIIFGDLMKAAKVAPQAARANDTKEEVKQ